MKTFNKLKKLRKNNGYDYKTFAKLINISSSYYWQIENGKRRLYYEMAKKISSVFNLKPDDIFYDEKD